MVNRVFCYSKQEAKKNKNNVSLWEMLLKSIGLIILFMIVAGIIIFSSYDLSNPLWGAGLILGFSALISLYALYAGAKFRTQLTAFATDSDSNIYLVTYLNNGQNFIVGGMAAEGIIDTLLGKNDSLLGDIVGTYGTVKSLKCANKSTLIMQNAEIIARMVENATNTTGVEIKQILKVNKYSQDSHKVKIWCDYKILNSEKIKHNKKIVVYKSFNCFDDLMNILLSKKGGN